jgi:hypothetical protein
MANSGPLSPITCLGKIRAAGRKLASLSSLRWLLRMFPGLPAAALAGVVIMFFAWSCEHQARQRDIEAAKQVKKQTDEEISFLRLKVTSALRDAKQSAQAAQELEGQRQKLVREAEGLRQRLESLRQQELAHTNEVATLPTSEVVSRVASRLQEQGIGNREQGTGRQEPVSGVGGQVSGRPAVNPLTGPALTGESATTGHPPRFLWSDGQHRGPAIGLPQGGEGRSNPAGEGRNNPEEERRNNPEAEGQNNPGGDGQKSPAALVLSDQGARKVETALIELDSCRQQTQVMGQQVSNCQQQTKLDSTLQQEQAGTIAKLNAALVDKDQILARSEEAHRAELRAARGTWRSRFLRAVEIFAGGFIAGVLVR